MRSSTVSPRAGWIRALVCLLILSGAGSPLVAQSTPAPLLFRAGGGSATRPLASRAAAMNSPAEPVEVLRSRPVDFDRSLEGQLTGKRRGSSAALLDALPSLTLNLFPDTAFELHVESMHRTSDGAGWTVSGPAGPARTGYAILVFYSGALSGSVRFPGGEFYEMHVPPSGDGEVRQCRFHGFPAAMVDAVVPAQEEVSGKETRPRPFAGRGIFPELPWPARAADASYRLDVLVAFTARSMEARGGAAGMLAHLHRVFAESNRALANSDVALELRLVQAVRVDWDDTATDMSYSIALNAMRSPTDGRIDELHSLRDQFGADLVSLWVNPPRPLTGSFTVGLAYLLTANPPGFDRFAYSVVHQTYAGGSSLTFPHEVGHNLGLVHDKDNGGGSGGLYGDSRGYQQKTLTPTFFTVMAYSTGCSGCAGIDYFSNPAILYQTVPTGIPDEANAAHTLRLVAPLAAEWSPTKVAPECTYAVQPASLNVPAVGGLVQISVTAPEGCPWMAQADAGWIEVASGAVGSGSAAVPLQLSSSGGTEIRSGTVRVAGLPVTLIQAAAGLPFSASPVSISFAAEAGSPERPQRALSFQTGGASISIRLSTSAPPWLKLSATEFTSPATITLTADPTGLAVGQHSTSLRFTATDALQPDLDLPVSFAVKRGRFLVSAAGVWMRVEEGGAPMVKTVRVQPPLSGESVPVLQSMGAPWLSAELRGQGSWRELDLQVNPQSLQAGVFDANLEISCPDASCDLTLLPMRLEVAPPRALAEGGANPRIGSGGIVNGASFAPGIASGAWMSVFGTALSQVSRGWAAEDFVGEFFPLELSDVAVRVNGVPAAVQYVSPEQINFQAPSGLSAGWQRVDVTTPTGTSHGFAYSAAEAPGFFQFSGDGQLAALHPNGDPVTAPEGAGTVQGRPASPGTVVALYGTGFGETNPPVAAGKIYSGAARLVAETNVMVSIGGVAATVEFAGLSAAGLNQLNVVIPHLTPGMKEVQARINGTPVQFNGTMRVE